MKLFDLFKKKKPKPRTEVDGDGNLIIAVKVDGYDKFVEQIEEMSRLVDTLSDKCEQLAELTEPITVINNHYNLAVNTEDAEMEKS